MYIYRLISAAFAQSCNSGQLPVWVWARGDLLWAQHRYQEASSYFHRGTESNPKHPLVLSYRLKLCYSLFRDAQITRSERYLKEILSEFPDNRIALTHLAILYRWSGRDIDAAWLLHEHAIESNAAISEDLKALYCLSVFDSYSTTLRDSAERIVADFSLSSLRFVRPQLALARYESLQGRKERALDILLHLLRSALPSTDAALYAAEICVAQRKSEEAKDLIVDALKITPDHPRLNSFLAEIYLKSGETFNAEFALPMALAACKSSGWMSVREMRILAEAYYHSDDKWSALLVAKRAKSVAEKLQSSRELCLALDHLIESIDIAVGS